MFMNNTAQTDTLERFRIKAHLRSYLKDPFDIDEYLMHQAVGRLKTLPYVDSDPSAKVALELLYTGFIQGYYAEDALTEQGIRMVKRYQPGRIDRKQFKQYSPRYCNA